jgi:hypothetical protein
MLEPLWGFLGWVVSAGLLLLAFILGKNGKPLCGRRGDSGLGRVDVFREQSILCQSPRDRMSKINEGLVAPPSRKIEFNGLYAVFAGL